MGLRQHNAVDLYMCALVKGVQTLVIGFYLLLCMRYCAIAFSQRSCMQTPPCSRPFLIAC